MTEEYETGGKLSRNIPGQHLIHGGNCRFAMRNNDTDDAQLADGLVYAALAVGVERAGRLGHSLR